MSKLHHDLKNKLGPIFSYFEVQRLMESNKSNPHRGFIDGVKEVELERQLSQLKLQCEQALPQIRYILEQLES